MSERPEGDVVGAIAIYRAADDLVDAIVKVRNSGFTRIDVISPYPLHGIDELMGRQRSSLGYVALVAGLVGTAFAKLGQWWISAVDYPVNIGGKPLFSWPAFIPITFELMVLVTAIVVVFGMFAIFNRLPHFGSAIVRSRHIRELTTDRLGLVIDARDPLFHADSIARVLGGKSVIDVELLYREPLDPLPKRRVLSIPFLLLVVLVAALTSSATWVVFRYIGIVPPFNSMKHQPKVDPQAAYLFFPDSIGMRAPVEGAIARGGLPYPYPNSPDSAGVDLVNPVPLTQGNLDHGQQRFAIFCRPCHGVLADGNGTLTSAFPHPPSLHSRKVRDWSDGRIFHVITRGQNVMASYASQIPADDRWRVIHYLRALQRSRNAPDGDMP